MSATYFSFPDSFDRFERFLISSRSFKHHRLLNRPRDGDIDNFAVGSSAAVEQWNMDRNSVNSRIHRFT